MLGSTSNVCPSTGTVCWWDWWDEVGLGSSQLHGSGVGGGQSGEENGKTMTSRVKSLRQPEPDCTSWLRNVNLCC